MDGWHGREHGKTAAAVHLGSGTGGIGYQTSNAKGTAKTSLALSLENLRKDFEMVETVAVAPCSGNSHGFVESQVGGGQLANGAMGNPRCGRSLGRS